jgi:glucokinase
MILAGDIGGTKTLLAFFEGTSVARSPVKEESYRSGEFSSLEEILDRFVPPGSVAPLRGACFAVAGPVVEGRSKITNLPWEMDERALGKALRTQVKLVNDLEGAAHGVLSIPEGDIEVLQAGAVRRGNMAVIAAGTGLGEAIVVHGDGRYQVIASEGGHADFAPRTDLEMALLRYLWRAHGRVSYERVVSGPGLHSVYRFLRETGDAPEPEWLRARLAEEDPGVVITDAAVSGSDPVCSAALDLFLSAYGAEAGNLALKALALGGVFVAGGIASKVLPRLRDGSFIGAFNDKGRLSDLMRTVRVSVVLNPRVALIGAARIAGELSGPAG